MISVRCQCCRGGQISPGTGLNEVLYVVTDLRYAAIQFGEKQKAGFLLFRILNESGLRKELRNIFDEAQYLADRVL